MKIKLNLIILSFFMIQSAWAVESIYTNLSEKSCQTIVIDNETASSKQTCPGVAGYNLVVLDDDARQSINIITPDGKEHPLNFWQVISSSFTSLGDKAEWYGIKKAGKFQPQALIVRVKAFEFPEQPEKSTSYLAVSKITGNKICITDKIPPSAKQNEQAHFAAEIAAGKPCLQ
jgi:hypothetical protein